MIYALPLIAILLATAPAVAGDKRTNYNLNRGAQAVKPVRPVEVTPNTMGGYTLRQGANNLGTLKPNTLGGYNYQPGLTGRNGVYMKPK